MKIALYHPAGWLKTGHWPYQNQTQNNSGKWNNALYLVNDYTLKDADFVVVHEDVDRPLNLKARSFILIPGEEQSSKTYSQEFVDQFDRIITSRNDIRHHQVLRTHYFHPLESKKNV